MVSYKFSNSQLQGAIIILIIISLIAGVTGRVCGGHRHNIHSVGMGNVRIIKTPRNHEETTE